MINNLESDVSLTTTLALLDGLNFPVQAGKKTKFRFELDATVGATADGILFHPDGPALTRLNYSVSTPSSTTAETVSRGNTSWKGASTTTTPPTTSPSTLASRCIVEGHVTCSASGSVNIWGVVEAAGSAILKAGSSVEYKIVES